ncbi:hypothetical protein [Aurantiacibacter sp. MUD61]|uniref:hypothetical protein n=1 Tax=Aurantiacibacter sp. MUD61 TaxID=3009083 RepID=UPI0022F0A247|nr:hypothetical protein [Aurantiacibacter sp. MUD61]
MLGNSKRSFGPFLGLDLVFIALALVASMMLFETSAEGADSIAAAANPLLAGLATIAAVVILTGVAVLGTKADQRMNDEFTYKAVAFGALVGVMVTILFHLAFDILPMASWGLGDLSKDRIVAVLMGSWATGYAIFRVRGTA